MRRNNEDNPKKDNAINEETHKNKDDTKIENNSRIVLLLLKSPIKIVTHKPVVYVTWRNF